MDDTTSESYADRLNATARWKSILDVQRPYRWNLQRLNPGFTLDIGCGVGRNLSHINGIGVDHNAASITIARQRGYEAYTVGDFANSEHNRPQHYDTLLFAHVLEHMDRTAALGLLLEYQPLLKDGGQVIAITPQEVGYRSDPTHVEFMDGSLVTQLLIEAKYQPVSSASFPFPRWLGKFFKYNEFVTVGHKP